jgi:hypothetical protein
MGLNQRGLGASMYAIIVRIYSAVLWLGLVVGFVTGYYYVKMMAAQMGPDAPAMYPLLGGLVGLFIAIVVLGAGFTLAGIYENTLATANALRRMSGGAGTAGSTASTDSNAAIGEALPLHAGHWLFILGLVGFLIFMVYFGLQRFGA